jgi:hypothetical protein
MKVWKGWLRRAQIRFLPVAKQTGNAVGGKSIGAHILFNTTCPGELGTTRLIYGGGLLAASSLIERDGPYFFQQHVTSVHVISSWNRRKLSQRTR